MHLRSGVYGVLFNLSRSQCRPDHMTPRYKPQTVESDYFTTRQLHRCSPELNPLSKLLSKKKKKKKYEGGGGVISNQTFPTKQPLKAHVAACHQIWTWVQPQWSESHSSCSRIGDSSLLRSGWARWKALVGMFIIPSSRQSADHRLDYSDSHFLGCLN